MGRVAMKVWLNVATLRISSLPPRRRYWYLLILAVCCAIGVAGFTLMWIEPRYYGWWWLMMILGVGAAAGITGWHASVTDTVSSKVEHEMSDLDSEYQELVERFWNDYDD
jgi:hypothetical protein